MKTKIKYGMPSIGILGVLFGRILNRVLESYFGNNASNIVVTVLISIVFCAILIIIVAGYLIKAIILLIMAIPIIVEGIGLYLNNMNIVVIGIVLVFIIYPILIKVIPKLNHDRKMW